MQEPPDNIYLSEGRTAKPELVQGKDLTTFIGRFVKTAFHGKDLGGKPRTEHMWVEVKSIENGKFVGLLNNDPMLEYDPPLSDGTEVTVEPTEISDVCD